jgi:hypothetical protein
VDDELDARTDDRQRAGARLYLTTPFTTPK